jgi:hypothetical protein
LLLAKSRYFSRWDKRGRIAALLVAGLAFFKSAIVGDNGAMCCVFLHARHHAPVREMLLLRSFAFCSLIFQNYFSGSS